LSHLKRGQDNANNKGINMLEKTNGYSYPKTDELIPITTLVSNLKFTGNKHDFSNDNYLPIIFIKASNLFVDEQIQRFISQNMIRSAKRFDGNLVRPLYVFKRPNGKYSVADGQHQTVMGIFYTNLGENLELPCQVRIHPEHFTIEQCLMVEAEFFKALNFRRRNVGKVDKLRADIAIQDEQALRIEQQLDDMGVRVENIGCQTGPEVYGYDKIMEAYHQYSLVNVLKAIKLYISFQKNSKASKWNDVDKPLNGGLIGGISAIYYLLNTHLGEGDKSYALLTYLSDYLFKTKPTGKESIMTDTAGVKQSVLIARRIVDRCNALTEIGVLTKQNGERLEYKIGEEVMFAAKLGDPSKM